MGIFDFNITHFRSFQVQLIRIQLRVPEYGWTTQKAFHLMNVVVNGCKINFAYLFILLKSLQIQSSSPYILRLNVWTVRAVLFGLYQSVFLLRPKVRFLPDGFHFSE